MEHLAIMDKNTIKMILNGEKTIETRFSKNKISPYQKVKIGDKVYLKESGKNIIAFFEIEKAIFFKDLNSGKIKEIKNNYNNLIKASDDYWNKKLNSNYGTLIFIKNVKKLDKPLKISKKDRRGFVSYNKLKKDGKYKSEKQNNYN